MIVQRSIHREWLTNTYLISSADGDDGALVDAGGPIGPLAEFAAAHHIALTHILLTHRHEDHVAELDAVMRAFPDIVLMGHPDELRDLPQVGAPLRGEEVFRIGSLIVEALNTPGHTSGMLAYRTANAVFTSDTIYRGSIGGIRSPGHTTFQDLRKSIMEVILALPDQTVLYPGHGDATTVAAEKATNPFARVWSGLEAEARTPCHVAGAPAQALVIARDYDGGTKAWVRWPSGEEDVVPGSIVGLVG